MLLVFTIESGELGAVGGIPVYVAFHQPVALIVLHSQSYNYKVVFVGGVSTVQSMYSW